MSDGPDAGSGAGERLIASADLPEGEVRQVDLGDGRVLALYRVEGECYATDDLCTHGDASLADGEIEGGEIVCPYHMGKFDIRTGEATGAPCSVAVKTWAVREEGGEVFLVG